MNKKDLTKENHVLSYNMKEMILLLILSSLAARIAAANKIPDADVSQFVKRLAYKESNRALGAIL